jgi:hypothetical protein
MNIFNAIYAELDDAAARARFVVHLRVADEAFQGSLISVPLELECGTEEILIHPADYLKLVEIVEAFYTDSSFGEEVPRLSFVCGIPVVS